MCTKLLVTRSTELTSSFRQWMKIRRKSERTSNECVHMSCGPTTHAHVQAMTGAFFFIILAPILSVTSLDRQRPNCPRVISIFGRVSLMNTLMHSGRKCKVFSLIYTVCCNTFVHWDPPKACIMCPSSFH